tara:strand:+ start:326 stop:1903 length:1578 start_codon:yes stop_codon:yes gene_type:complete
VWLSKILIKNSLIFFIVFFSIEIFAHSKFKHKNFSEELIYNPTPYPDRIILTWEGDPSTSQVVNWRTDTTIKQAYAQIVVANSNGRSFNPTQVKAKRTYLKTDINDAYFHNVSFKNLKPNTLYAYRVGDGEIWSEYFHFKTANNEEKPFSFIYLGDAQNQIKTHWSRVFREAFREEPRAAFIIHAGDLINIDNMDKEWGEWHNAPGWVNGTIPIIATPGNHEYQNASKNNRIWTNKYDIDININILSIEDISPGIKKLMIKDNQNQMGFITIKDSGEILNFDPEIEKITGYNKKDLIDNLTFLDKKPIFDRLRNPKGTKIVSKHWRPQFSFPIQNVPDPRLKETVYFLDYQGVRIISLDSNIAVESQKSWLRKVLKNNPNKWTIVTFHHPLFSTSYNRNNVEIRKHWKPILDEFRVDLILSGHDHSYMRTGIIKNISNNVSSDSEKNYDPNIGTVNVISVSGPKMYEIKNKDSAKKFKENTQLYQIIFIDDKKLRFRSYTAVGELYDEFILKKRIGKPNLLVEMN